MTSRFLSVSPDPSVGPTGEPSDLFTVLLLEDSPTDRLLVRSELECDALTGMVIVEAERLEEALALLRTRKIDLTLTDLDLPDARGLVTIDRLREHAAEVPIIVLTGQRDEQLSAEVLRRGVQDFLVKGHLAEHMLARTIRSAIDRHRFTTQLDRHARALAENERRIRTIFDANVDPMLIVDAGGVVQFANQAAGRMFARDVDSLVGSNLATAPLGQPAAEFEITRPDGTASIVEQHVVAVSWEDGDASLVTLHDVTEQRRVAAALRQNEQRFRDYAETASDWFWETDAEHRITYLSDRVRQFGMAPELRLGKRRSDLILVDHVHGDRELRDSHMAMLDRHEPFRNVILRTRADDGSIRTVCLSGNPAFGPDGEFHGYRGSARDDTERLLTEQRLHEAQKMDAVGQLTGGVAHDFNNFLTVVLGNLALIRRQGEVSTDMARYVDAAHQAATRGAQLVSRLLTFSRQQVLEPAVINLNEAVQRIVPLIERTIGEHIQVCLEMAPQALAARLDSAQLESSILNLCINARDAMPQTGGRLTIETRMLAGNEMEGTAPGGGGASYVVVAVRDTGCGMSPEVKARVLEPFFTTKERGKGTGLGLSMVFGFVKQSGGHLIIESEVDQGTTTKMLFPSVTAPQDVGAEAADEAEVAGLTKKVVLVEDDDDVRAVLVSMLEFLDCEVAVASNGVSALNLLQSLDRIDVLITDVIMPGGMSGIDLAKTIRLTRPRLKILFSSGYADVRGRSELDGMQDVAWIAKPYDVRKLGRKLGKLLED